MKKFNAKSKKRKLWIRQHKSSIVKYSTLGISLVILTVAIMYFTRAEFSAKVTFDVIDAKVSEIKKFAINLTYSNATYTNKTNVQDALDELYSKLN